MTHTFERTLFEVSRDADHLDARELRAQTGQPISGLVLRNLEGKGD